MRQRPGAPAEVWTAYSQGRNSRNYFLALAGMPDPRAEAIEETKELSAGIASVSSSNTAANLMSGIQTAGVAFVLAVASYAVFGEKFIGTCAELAGLFF